MLGCQCLVDTDRIRRSHGRRSRDNVIFSVAKMEEYQQEGWEDLSAANLVFWDF